LLDHQGLTFIENGCIFNVDTTARGSYENPRTKMGKAGAVGIKKGCGLSLGFCAPGEGLGMGFESGKIIKIFISDKIDFVVQNVILRCEQLRQI